MRSLLKIAKTGYVDSVKQFEYDASAAGGKVGLRVYNAVALFDNIAVYSGVVAPEGAEQAEDLTLAGTTPEIKDPEIFVNQIGYDNGTSMRATIPNADGKEFKVVNAATKAVVRTGTVEKGIADFTGLTADTDTTFYITCADKQQSYDFEIGTNLIQRRSMKQALAFMVQTRSDANVKGDNSIAWRDSHQFSFELNGLVLQYMANPSVYDNMPQTIFAESTYVGTNKLTGTEYEDLKTQNEPDIIWLIKFAALLRLGLHAGQKAAHADKGAAGLLSLSRAGADRARLGEGRILSECARLHDLRLGER